MTKFCAHEKHGGICEKTDSFCNLGPCLYEDLKEYAPVRHGRWVEDHDYLRCPNCSVLVKRDFTFFDLGEWNYCPNCGAKMDADG